MDANAIVCPGCGAENPAGKRFCGDCGAQLDAAPAAGTGASAAPTPARPGVPTTPAARLRRIGDVGREDRGALLALLGLEGDIPADQLFAAWRTSFERLAVSGTVVLVLEDFHFADSGLLGFVDHLLEWSRGAQLDAALAGGVPAPAPAGAAARPAPGGAVPSR